jgi:hypothetical protein
MLLEADQLGVNLTKGEILLGDERGDNRIVLEVEAGEDVGNEVIVVDRFAGSCQFIPQDVHLVDVVDNGEVTLLSGGEGNPGVYGASSCHRREVSFNDRPCFCGDAAHVNLGEALLPPWRTSGTQGYADQ